MNVNTSYDGLRDQIDDARLVRTFKYTLNKKNKEELIPTSHYARVQNAITILKETL